MLEDAGALIPFFEGAAPVIAPRPARPTKPHYLGHRQRLRDRAATTFLGMPDYEVLELLLARSLPRGDLKPLAKALLMRFGGLAGVLGASLEELKTVKGVGQAAALDLKLVHEATARMGRGAAAGRAVIGSWSALLAYAKVAMAGASREQFRVLFLDKKNQLIADERMGVGQGGHPGAQPPVRRSHALGRRCRHHPQGGRSRAGSGDHRP